MSTENTTQESEEIRIFIPDNTQDITSSEALSTAFSVSDIIKTTVIENTIKIKTTPLVYTKTTILPTPNKATHCLLLTK